MKFDRNTVIGFSILAVLFFALFYFNNQDQAKTEAWRKEQARIKFVQDSTKRYADSVAQAKARPVDTLRPLQSAADSAGFLLALQGTETRETVENDVLRISFSNRGAQPAQVELKNFKGPDSNLVRLAANNFDRFTYRIQAVSNRSVAIDSLYFPAPEKATTTDGGTTLTYRLRSPEGHEVAHEYTIRPNNYMVDFNLTIDGIQQVVGSNTLNLTWQAVAAQQQKDIEYERGQSRIAYKYEGDTENDMAPGGGSKEFKSAVAWVAIKQQFFNTALVSKTGFSSGNIIWTSPTEKTVPVVAQATANLQVPLQGSGKATAALGFYFGPNDYSTLKQYGNDMEDMVDLGSGVFAFVKYINRWVVIPAFNFFDRFTNNYGIVILLLTLVIRLLFSPLMYPGYVTSAKMKILRPELEQLKLKHPDQQEYAMEQMKFTREAGVNQFAGCLPGLLQIPIFFALYSFFNSAVILRGQPFLWSKDLSQYDSILNLPFSIPLYGDHVSLFTITAVLTSFLISLYSMTMAAPDQNNPVLKYMPYFFPFVLLFVFNKLPSGLTWYYTVSNTVTLILQFVIQNYIINHDKLLAKMEANRKKPKKKNSFQERLLQMQEQQRQLQQQQKKK